MINSYLSQLQQLAGEKHVSLCDAFDRISSRSTLYRALTNRTHLSYKTATDVAAAIETLASERSLREQERLG